MTLSPSATGPVVLFSGELLFHASSPPSAPSAYMLPPRPLLTPESTEPVVLNRTRPALSTGPDHTHASTGRDHFTRPDAASSANSFSSLLPTYTTPPVT